MVTKIGDGNNNIIFGTQGDDEIWGLGGDDTLIGGGGQDTLYGGTGDDVMDGGADNDFYYVDSLDDVVVENANKGIDTIHTSVTYSLNWAANVENLALSGSADIDGYGNGLDNSVYGNSGDNDLFGFDGNDVLKGAGGDDALIGGSGDDTMVGGSGDDYLNGGVDGDTMIGGTGDDYYVFESYGDTVTESANEGIDTIASSIGIGIGANVENLILTGSSAIGGAGNELDNEITGNTNNNMISGGLGADKMRGGGGNDTYDVDNKNDVIIEFAGEGTDHVVSSISYTLGTHLEHLFLNSSNHIDGFGNSTDNTLIGGSGNNVLDGGLGKDSMQGREGNDSYHVDNMLDFVAEKANEGDDVVYSTVDYTIGDHVETLSLALGNAVAATGNSQHNTIFGNANNNVLDGGGANDILSGLGGNDTFVFQAGQANGDVVYEFEGNGAAEGDVLKFTGYGPGATFTQQTATEWFITSGDGTIQEVITLVGGPTVHASDFVFV